MMEKDDKYYQTHVHEFLGSTFIYEEKKECHYEEKKECHNHRFAGVSGEAIPCKDSHVHEIWAKTDYVDKHFHKIEDKSGPAIWVAPYKHVHFVYGKTSCNDDHVHKFVFATLIEDPLCWKYCPKGDYDYYKKEDDYYKEDDCKKEDHKKYECCCKKEDDHKKDDHCKKEDHHKKYECNCKKEDDYEA